MTSCCIKVGPHVSLRARVLLGARVSSHTSHHVQVYALETVLKLKRDPTSQIVFLDEAMKVRAAPSQSVRRY
ncbi:uncharacterized protein LAESUDRAFT_68768 [Laetiporus sulphureus 93-53]|uniref:Conserved oligomeric Golgi complex subunit 5 helical domain-containing protein n=1 Tax=Laetiporus sulphureus 93-53 TaxID=1314785 RepID=A0A165F6A7_9APHY|nr:uncharacterized protein LAESUDRAFT_68768 [Laetiporus sulphureus 93-53]KZT08475.1 hypothetical protein LAESUDRAFT_68768 [Laetiporus sulphureus 93-53]